MCALRHIRWLNVAILVNIMTMGLMYHYEGIYQLLGVTLTAKTDPMRMVRGWDVLGQAVGQALKAYPHRVLLTENRKILSELIYYVHPHPFNAVLFNPHGEVSNHFHLNQRMADYAGQDFLCSASLLSKTDLGADSVGAKLSRNKCRISDLSL